MDANLAHLVSWAYQSKGDIPPALTVGRTGSRRISHQRLMRRAHL
jgi:hypothetical protein